MWETTYQGLETDRRYFVEASWSADRGLHLYVNGDQVDRRAASDSITREPGTATETRAFIGRSSDGDELTNAVIDGVDIYYGNRDMLSSIGYIQKGFCALNFFKIYIYRVLQSRVYYFALQSILHRLTY